MVIWTASARQVVLTSDRGSFSEYNRSSVLGYFACMPARLVPRPFMDFGFTPPMPVTRTGEARTAPYALRKVEAALLSAGVSQVAVVPPEHLADAIGPHTRVVGVTAHDPFGLSPVTTKLTMLFGGGPSWNAVFFEQLGDTIARLKERQPFTVIAGGPGIWQMTYRRPAWVDVVFQGEAEVDFPVVVRSILAGEKVPPLVQGRSAKLEEIPRIVKPARVGEVQVTRGCPRGCEFCSITPETYRSIPIDDVLAEVRVNMASGERTVELLTDDLLLYGASKLHPNHNAVVHLFEAVKQEGASMIFFPHISAPAVREAPETLREISRIADYAHHPGESPVVGLETGSVRIFEKYMRAKSFPWKPNEWWDVVLEATRIMNDVTIWPCYTLTIGYADETNADVDESVGIVQALIERDLKAWIFPLPVIPISTSRLRGHRFPDLERLPTRYWDLLGIAWQRNLHLARELAPTITGRMRNSAARRLVMVLIEQMTQKVEGVFRELRETDGQKSRDFTTIDLDSPFGAVRSIYWIARSAITA